MNRPIWSVIILSLVALGCASSPQPTVENGLATYKNTRAYLLDSIREELKPIGGVESEDAEVGSISSAWQVRLSPFDQMGMRTRVVVTYKGDEDAGFEVSAAQETESNTNQKAPLEGAVADWKPTSSDGNLAARFLQNLDRRLRPNDAWKNRRAR